MRAFLCIALALALLGCLAVGFELDLDVLGSPLQCHLNSNCSYCNSMAVAGTNASALSCGWCSYNSKCESGYFNGPANATSPCKNRTVCCSALSLYARALVERDLYLL